MIKKAKIICNDSHMVVYEGGRKCLINYTNGITENITTITWMLGVGGTSSKSGTVIVSHRVKCNIMD